MAEVFDELMSVNVNGHTEVKNTGSARLTYLSWPFAWAEVKKRYPSANYEIEKFNGLPYVLDPLTGIMVYTKVTIEGVTHEMWLPVMDGSNKAMKAEPYTIHGKYKDVEVAAATMFDINKTVMRCLVKNLAMFGLGLYIYAGEDLPITEEVAKEEQKMADNANLPIDSLKLTILKKRCADDGIPETLICTLYKVADLAKLTEKMFSNLHNNWERVKEKAHGSKG